MEIERIRAIQDNHSCSLYEAKQIYKKREMFKLIDGAESIRDIKCILKLLAGEQTK